MGAMYFILEKLSRQKSLSNNENLKYICDSNRRFPELENAGAEVVKQKCFK